MSGISDQWSVISEQWSVSEKVIGGIGGIKLRIPNSEFSSMTGFWEILLILIILGTVVWPWYQRRQVKKRVRRRPRRNSPPAREVDYEDDQTDAPPRHKE
jgi:hypothetical protein